MPIGSSEVQAVTGVTSATVDVTATWGSTTTTGNLLVACLGLALVANPGAPAVSPPSGWTDPGIVVESAANHRTQIFYIQGAAPRSGGETFSWAGALDINDAVLILIEWAGVATSGALDQSNTSSGSSTTGSTGTTPTTTQADELVIGIISNRNNSTQSSPTNSFVEVAQGQSTNATTSNRVNAAAYARVVSATGTYGTSATISSSRPWTGAVASFFGAVAQDPIVRKPLVAPSVAAVHAATW